MMIARAAHTAALACPLSAVARPAPAARPYITRSALAVLRETRIGQVAQEAFRFQRHGRCWENVTTMTHDVIDGLRARGLLKRNPALTWLARRVLPDEGLAPLGRTPTLQDLRRIQDCHGAVHLSSSNTLQPGQGEDVYQTFHSNVLLAVVPMQGCTVGLLLEGNDRQDNPATQLLHRTRRDLGDDRPLHMLSPRDLKAVTDLAREQLGSGVDVMQAAFRFVDMDQFLRASARSQPAHVMVDPAGRRFVDQTFLADREVRLLQQAMQEDPSLVESFPGHDAGPLPPKPTSSPAWLPPVLFIP